MKCPNCDTENPQGAAFCLHCGKRLDGNIACPHCGKTIPATAAFCLYCGKRTDEPATPNASASPSGSAPAQPAAPQAAPVPPVAPVQPVAPVPPVAPQQVPVPPAYVAPVLGEVAAARPALSPEERAAKRNGILQKIMHYGARGSSLAMALFALVFVFLIGVSMSVSGGGVSGGSGFGYDVYYYFGQAYSNALSVSGSESVSMMMQAVYGSLMSAATLVCTAVFAIIGIIQGIMKLVNKNKTFKRDYGLVSFLLYLGGAVMFLGYHAMGTSQPEYSAGIVFNGGTAAGIALGTIAFVSYLGCRVVPQWKELLKTNLLNTIFALGSAVLTVVMLGLLSAPLYSMSVSYSSTVSMSSSYSVGMLLLNGLNIDSSTGSILMMLFVFTILLQFTVTIFSTIAFWKMLRSLQTDKVRPTLKWSIILTVFSAVFLIFAIAAGSVYTSANFSGMGFSYAVPIVLFVFALLLLGAGIARSIIRKRKEGPSPKAPKAPKQAYAPYGAQQPYNNGQYMQYGAQQPYGAQNNGAYGTQQRPAQYGAYPAQPYGAQPYGAQQRPAQYGAYPAQPYAAPQNNAQSAWQQTAQQPAAPAAAKQAAPAQSAWQQTAPQPAAPAAAPTEEKPASPAAETASEANDAAEQKEVRAARAIEEPGEDPIDW